MFRSLAIRCTGSAPRQAGHAAKSACKLRVATAATQRNRRCMSTWSNVPMGPKDPILGVSEAFKADPSPLKINLGVGAYRDDNNKPTVLRSVTAAMQRIHDAKLDNEYAPISGPPELAKLAVNLAYGADNEVVQSKRVAAIQSLSGTGALRLAGEFINRFARAPVYLPNPTWGNHIPIMTDSGLEVRRYRYYDPKTRGLDLNGVLEDMKNADNKSVFLLHACAHNPTGVDPKPEQWKEISALMKSKGHFALVDMAYQGFASGDVDRDSLALRTLLADGHELALCQSFAKNFGLYGQRVGAVSFVSSNSDEAARVESQLKILARPMYSNPPIAGARIVATVLGDAKLTQQWKEDVKEMADRIISMRTALYKGLKSAGSKHNWEHVIDQIGMFCYTGMSAEQVEELTSKHHVYLTKDGRISMAGITSKNVDYLAKAMHDVTK